VSSSKPPRDTRLRNRLFFTTVIAAVVIGLWLAR
jgi:predicted secreted protein